MSKFIDLLKPYDISNEKIRLGPPEDGGYVTSVTAIENSVALFTYGVGNDIRFEEHYTRLYNKPVYLYDHTIGQPTGWDLGKTLHFFNEGLGFVDRCEDFLTHYSQLNMTGEVLLKIDIEGNEFDYLEKVNMESLSNVTTGILLELHTLPSVEYRQRAEHILENLQNFYTLTHIHGNSWGTTFEHEGYSIPETVELSFVNNRYVTEKILDMQKYPIEGLDISNRPNYPDINLEFIGTLAK